VHNQKNYKVEYLSLLFMLHAYDIGALDDVEEFLSLIDSIPLLTFYALEAFG